MRVCEKNQIQGSGETSQQAKCFCCKHEGWISDPSHPPVTSAYRRQKRYQQCELTSWSSRVSSSGFKWESLVQGREKPRKTLHITHWPPDTHSYPHAQPCTHMHSHQNQSQQAKDAKMVVVLKVTSNCSNGACLAWTNWVGSHKLSMVAPTCNPSA